MKSQFSRWGIVLIAVTVAAGAVVYALTTRFLNSSATSAPPANALMIIAPYKHAGTWVFDDDRMGLVREPFVAGVPEMIDVLVKDIPNAANGFRCCSLLNHFPDTRRS